VLLMLMMPAAGAGCGAEPGCSMLFAVPWQVLGLSRARFSSRARLCAAPGTSPVLAAKELACCQLLTMDMSASASLMGDAKKKSGGHRQREGIAKTLHPWVVRSESRRHMAILREMLRTEPGPARAYFDQLCLEGKADSFHFSVMMDASPDFPAAQALLGQMERQGLLPQTTSYNVLLKKLCLAANMDVAEDLLVEMKERGMPPDERSYTQMVCGYSDLGNTEFAQSVFDRMQQAGFATNIQSWQELVAQLQIKVNTATLANMLSKGSEHRTQAEQFYQGLVASNATDVVLFNIMLNASRTVDEARAVWDDMHSANLCPSSTSYNTLLRVLCGDERIHEAMQLLNEAEAATLADERTYTRIISYLHQRGQVEEATQIFARCEQRLPSVGASTDDWEGAESEVEWQELQYMALVRRVASAAKTKGLYRLLKVGRVEEAWDLFEAWVSKGEADTFAYNTIMHGCGSASTALTLKTEMVASGVAVSSSTWNILVQLLAMEGRIAEAREILNEMEDIGLTPSERTLRPLLGAMRAVGSKQDARRIQQRCKLQRSVKEKEALMTVTSRSRHVAGPAMGLIPKGDKGSRGDDSAGKIGERIEMTVAEQDAAAAHVASAIVE